MKFLLTMIKKKINRLKLKFGMRNWYHQKGLTRLVKTLQGSEIFPWNYIIVAKDIF